MSSKRTKLRVETVKKTVKGRVYTSALLRRSYRRDGKVKHETVGNLTQLPPDVIDCMKRRLSGYLDENAPQSSFEIVRTLPRTGSDLGEVDVRQLDAAMDWLVERQTRIENKLAKKHLKDGHFVLFDVSSSYYTGRDSPLSLFDKQDLAEVTSEHFPDERLVVCRCARSIISTKTAFGRTMLSEWSEESPTSDLMHRLPVAGTIAQ